jgi:predicted RNA-binding Zn-ribbon protein involved in translation (DUF1610 family)
VITVYFACGHQNAVDDRAMSPVCPTCGNTQVARAIPNRTPRFVGACRGPYAETCAVDPAVVNVAPAGPLRVKERTE